jgi:rSAM/selenodomain-associated transferase 2
LNEESCLGETLTLLRRQQPAEIIVVDGGSRDDTCRIAAQADRLVHAPPGRAAQMNAGARQARSDILLFLHADCTLEDEACADAARALRRPRVIAGCFTMSVRARGWFYRGIDWCAGARVRLTGIAYGDQGLFLRRDRFLELGGFPDLRLMEDLFFTKQLRRLGKVVVLPRRIFVSPRRWQQVGVVRQTLKNWTLTALAAGGVHPDRLAEFYPAVRGGPRGELAANS